MSALDKLKFEWVSLFNFKRYSGEHKFMFPQTPGLYLLTGKNLAYPRLGTNDVGKTSLLDAVFWAFYGYTPRGLRAGEIITRNAVTAVVTVCFHIGPHRHIVCRKQSPNSLDLDDKVVDQDTLLKTIRLTADQFNYAIMRPQFGEAFFDLKPAPKLTLFSQIMGLEFWLEKSEQAATEAGGIAALIKKADDETSRKEGQFEALEADIAHLKRQVPIDHSKTILGLEQRLAKATQNAQTAGANWQKHNSAKMLAHNEVLHAQEALDNISKVGAKCPTCLQTVSQAHLGAEKKRLGSHLIEVLTHEQAALADSEASLAELRGFERDIKAIEQNLRDFRRKQAEFDLIARQISQKQEQLGVLTKALSALLTELDDLKVAHKAVDFWVGGFKRVRLFIVDEILRQLEIQVNNSLSSLGVTDHRIKFDVERETKSGSISKGFTVLIYPPGLSDPVRLEAYGGGVTQRLRLAGDLGLSDLIMDQAGMTNTLEVYDEPSQHLSQEGLTDLLDTLQQRAMDNHKIIFIVDHHALDFAFDGIYTVIADKNGSRIES